MRFVAGPGCSSSIGAKDGGVNKVKLAQGCSENAVRHEIGHRIGLLHEQVRGDRDEFVRIDFDNIVDGRENNFERFDRGILSGDYDLHSLMHYGAYAFRRPAEYAWSTTWSGAGGYEVGGQNFVLIFNTATRAYRRYLVEEEGRLDEPAFDSGFFSRRWTDILHFRVGNRLFEFRFRRNNGRFEVMRIADDGTRGSRQLQGQFPGPHRWAAPAFFQAPSEPRLVMYRNARPGRSARAQIGAARLQIYRVDALGQIISPPKETRATSTTDHLATMRGQDGRDFVFAVRDHRRLVSLFEIQTNQVDGNLNDRGMQFGHPRWGPSGWTDFDLVRSDRGYRVVTYRADTGGAYIGSLPDQGVRNFNATPPSEWMTVEPQCSVFQGYHVANDYHVLMIRNRRRRSEGWILRTDARDSAIDGYAPTQFPTIVRLDSDDPDFGSTGVMTAGDIEAANSLCQSNLHCHRVAGDGQVGERIFVDHDTIDIDDAHGLETTSARFVALGDRTAGVWTVKLVRREGQFFEASVPVAGFSAWTSSTMAQRGNRQYLYLHDAGSGSISWIRFRGRPFDLGDQQVATGFGAYSQLESFRVGDDSFLFLYDETNGDGAIVAIGANGAVDSDDLTAVDGLRGGWDDVCAYSRGTTTQVMFVRRNRRPEVWRAAEDGLSLTQVEDIPDMGRGWTNCAHLPTVNALIIYRRRDGLMHTWSIDNSGNPNERIQERHELPDWPSMTAYRAARGPRLLMLRQRWS
jgi:hypothetical protein